MRRRGNLRRRDKFCLIGLSSFPCRWSRRSGGIVWGEGLTWHWRATLESQPTMRLSAIQFILTAERIPASQALTLGLVDELVPAQDLLDAAARRVATT